MEWRGDTSVDQALGIESLMWKLGGGLGGGALAIQTGRPVFGPHVKGGCSGVCL